MFNYYVWLIFVELALSPLKKTPHFKVSSMFDEKTISKLKTTDGCDRKKEIFLKRFLINTKV